jgi:predicted lipid carrier protein YhbT
MAFALSLPRLPSFANLSAPDFPGALLEQTLDVVREYLPSPAPLISAIDQRVPVTLKQLLAEAPLNRIFAGAIAEGEFDEYEGRRIRLEINGGQPGITLGFWCGRLRIVEGPGEATIRGSWRAFHTLAERKQDPDQLFFQRKLVIEGDTELGLGLKNLLDSIEWNFRLR